MTELKTDTKAVERLCNAAQQTVDAAACAVYEAGPSPVSITLPSNSPLWAAVMRLSKALDALAVSGLIERERVH